MLLDKQVHGDAQQNELRHDGFRVRIDAEDIENIVCRDLLNQRRDALNAENQLERTLHQLLDTGAEEGDRHENTRYKEEWLERKLDGEIADRDKDRRQDDDRDRNAQPKSANAVALLRVGDDLLIEQDHLCALAEYRKKGGEAER